MQQRVNACVWLMAHGSILTNEARYPRGMMDEAGCAQCWDVLEDILDVLRDCKGAREIWSALRPKERVSKFYNLPLGEWFLKNLKTHGEQHDEINWAEKMAITCWLLWHWRNLKIFRAERTSLSQQVQTLVGCFEETKNAK